MNIGPGLTNQSVAPYSVVETLDQIHELDSAVLTLQETGGTIVSTGAEQTLYLNDNPLGCFNPRVFFIDLDDMIAGDIVVVRVYYRLNAGGDLQLKVYEEWDGEDGGLADGMVLDQVQLDPNRFGIEITLEQTATANGYDSFDWEVFVEE